MDDKYLETAREINLYYNSSRPRPILVYKYWETKEDVKNNESVDETFNDFEKDETFLEQLDKGVAMLNDYEKSEIWWEQADGSWKVLWSNKLNKEGVVDFDYDVAQELIDTMKRCIKKATAHDYR